VLTQLPGDGAAVPTSAARVLNAVAE